MQKLLQQQQIISESLRKILVNFKKDSASRKNADYIKKRLDAIEELWAEFELNNTLLTTSSECQTDDYFTTMAFDKVKQEYKVIHELLTNYQVSSNEEKGVPSKTDELMMQQSTNFRAFMRTVKNINISDIQEQWEIEDKIKLLQARWKTIDDLHWQIDNLLVGADVNYELDYTKHESVFEATKRELNSALNSTKHRFQSVPKIEIPTFSGSYAQWPTFMDLFSEAIHNNPQLTKGQKMQHLKGKLRGEAERLVQHLNVSAENYDSCWDIITHRYNNVQLLFTKQIQIFMNQPSIQQQTAFEIKRLHDVSLETIHAIHNLGVNTSTWDPILVHILTGKLDTETYTAYMEMRKAPRELPSFDELIGFLEGKFTALEPVKKPKNILPKQNIIPTKEFASKSINIGGKFRSTPRIHLAQTGRNCPICKTHHILAHCKVFHNMASAIKLKTIKQLHICQNCLYIHNNAECNSTKTCKICGNQHHTMLHDAFETNNLKNERSMTSNEAPYNEPSTTNPLQLKANHASESRTEVLLATVQLKIMAVDGTYVVMRCLLDQGSQISLITEAAAQRLGLPRRKQNATVLGVGISATQSNGTIHLACESLYGSYGFTTEALVMKKVLNNLPNYSFEQPSWPHIRNINLADPDFNISRPVDILLDASVYAQIILEGVIRGPSQAPIAQQTKIGWVLLGGNVTSFNCHAVLNSIDDIALFWESEEITESQDSNNMSVQEEYCENLYQNTTRRLSDGRYEVRIPMKQQFEQKLGSSKSQAVAQFWQLEKRLANNESLAKSYRDFIQEYLKLQHMKICKLPTEPSYFLPHHGVFKLDSTTTKLRVVFNASAKTKSGFSLNDLMEQGPNLQKDLQALILRWRTYQFVYKADIEKFYRQIRVHEKDQALQKIVWRNTTDNKLTEFQLCTVTYGTKAAPYLAMRTIKRLVEDDGLKYPLAADILSHQLYVDDILGGSNHLLEALQTQQQLIEMLKGAGFNLRKWASNNSALLAKLPQDLVSQNMMNFKQAETNKTLGIQWNPCTDNFTFNRVVDTYNKGDVTTKRSLLSDLSRLYDPLGWLSPVTIKAKIIFQQVWKSSVTWDDPLPQNIKDEWRLFREDLPSIQNVSIQRWLGNTQKPIELHGFSDASEKAYGCVIYCKSLDSNNQPVINIIAGKTKLVPLKKHMSLPRLELCAALLLSRLMYKVIECTNVQTASIHAWTDSMVVLGWLHGDVSRWKTFVANRVSLITKIIPTEHWQHVKSEENPADCASRGLSPSQFLTYSLWWTGPTWLKNNTTAHHDNFTTQEEIKKQNQMCVMQCETLCIESLLQNYSSVRHVIRVLCWVLRFINITRNKVHNVRTLNLSVTEIENAHNIIIKTIQNICFTEDIDRLRNNKAIRSTSNILSLNPFLDEDGILRVGGRLTHSHLTERQKHPIILPTNHRLTELLIIQAHQQTLHGGARLTLAHLRNKYWIIGGMRTVKKQLTRCVKCHRYKQNKSSQLMADLPKWRVTPSRPFTHTGVDFTGRVEVKANKGRGIKTTSGYVAVFICLCTKAIHLELVSDLSSITFLAALKRFCARRGVPSEMYSDNGTNFVGAAKMLQKEHKEALQYYINSEVMAHMATVGIKWNFNAPAWPSAGGLWEAAVKSMKHHLHRVLGEQKLTYEEFATVLTQIEACLNSRPLIAITEDADDVHCLTPGHFLVGGPLLAPPLATNVDNINLTTRWNLTTKMHRDFWKRWSTDYLQSLQARGKWLYQTRNIEVDDIVLVKEDHLPPCSWLLGRVTETHPGADGRVRVVTLKTKSNTLKRPVSKLSRLPLDHNKTELPLDHNNPTQPDGPPEQNTTPRRQRRKRTFFEYVCLLLMCLTMCAASPVEEFYNSTELDASKLIYFDKIADMNVIQDRWTMVVYYNMSSYWRSLDNIQRYVKNIKGLCNQNAAIVNIASQFQHELDELNYYNDMLQSEHGKRTKRGLIDGVGYVANSLFGVLDERFAVKYRKDIKYLHNNEEHLLSLYKQHTSIIEGEYSMLKRHEEVMNKQFTAISQHLQQMDNRVKTEQERVLYITTSVIAANMIISNLRRMQDVLLDLVTDVRNGRMDTHLLRPDEFQQQLNIVSSHIPNDLSVPCRHDHSCIQQMYKLAHVHMRLIEDFLIFEVKLPLISNDQYELNQLIPIPYLNGRTATRIVLTSNYLAVNLRKDLLLPLTSSDITSCEQLNENKLLCTMTLPTYNIKATSSICEAQVINNIRPPSCKTKSADCYDEWIKLHSRDAWLFSCCSACRVQIFCRAGIRSQVLHNTGIITLAEGCILKGDDILIHAHYNLQSTVTINRNEEYIPESGINHIINSSSVTFTPEDHSEQLRHIKHSLEAVKMQQEVLNERAESHDNHHYSIYATLLLIGVIIGACVVLKIKAHFQNNSQQRTQRSTGAVHEMSGVAAHLQDARADNIQAIELSSCSSERREDRASSPITNHRN